MSKIPLTLEWFSGYAAGSALVFVYDRKGAAWIAAGIYWLIAFVLHIVAVNKYKNMTSLIQADVKVNKSEGENL